MASDCPILHRTLAAQRAAFATASDPLRFGLTLKAIAHDSGIPLSTLCTYARGEAAMPLHAFAKLLPVLPASITSRMIDGTGKHIADDADPGDHDTLAGKCIDFAAVHAQARHPQSPGGIDIAPCERRAMDERAQALGVPE